MILPLRQVDSGMLLSLFLFLCFLAGIAVSSAWRRLALAYSWFDYPNERSSHTRPTPKGGGLGLALVLLLVLLMLRRWGLIDSALLWMSLPGVGLALVGIVDDLRELGVLLRLCVQVGAVMVALVVIGGPPPLPFPGHVLVHPLLWLIVVPGWVWLINLYNFMDGIDGIAAAEGIFVALALAWFALAGGSHAISLLLLVLVALLAGFLCLNWAPAILFMGDAGSNFLGFTLAACGLKLALEGVITPWTLLILLGCFVSDSTLTLLKRMWSGAVWYHGHRSHAYQVMARIRGSHADVVVALTAINVCWLLPLAAISVALPGWGWVCLLLAYLPLVVLVHHSQRKYLGTGLK